MSPTSFRIPSGAVISRWLLVVVAIAAILWQTQLGLGDLSTSSGWLLLASFLFLGLYGARKKVPFLPLGRVSSWLSLHIGTGLIAVALFFVHTGGRWPSGGFETTLWFGFILLAASGIVGWGLQRLTPSFLHSGDPLFSEEQIPREIAIILQESDQLLTETSPLGSSEVLSHFYRDRLRPWLSAPREQWAHLIDSRRPRLRLASDFSEMKRYIDLEAREPFDELEALASGKLELDRQHAWHRLSHGWLLVHLPLTGVLLVTIFVHVLVVRSHTEGAL